MLKYTTKEIVSKALQLADLVNSDFISYNENLTLLNDAYSQLYQKAIDCADKLYIKEFTLDRVDTNCFGTETAYDLPCDFYQLYSIKDNDGFLDNPIPRKVKSDPSVFRSYDIRNNQLIIYGSTASNIKVEYYPIPDTLFLKADDLDISNYGSKAVAYCGHNLVMLNENSLEAYDVSTGDQLGSYSLGLGTITDVIVEAGDSGFICNFKEDGVNKTAQADWNSDEVIVGPTDDQKYILRYSNDMESGVFLEDKTEETTNVISCLDAGDMVFYMSKEGEDYILRTYMDEDLVNESTLSLDPNTKRVSLKKFANNSLYILIDKKILVIDINDYTIEEEVYSRGIDYVDVGNVDLATGYGFLANKRGRGYFITSCFRDTKLDYPNNFYFNYLAYRLAISYKVKQDADASQLSMLANEAADQYYDTLKRDTDNFIRISNAYSGISY